MFKDRLVTLLNIRPEETRLVALMAALFLCVQAGYGVGDTTAFALFVSHNVERLPYMYVPLGMIIFVVSMGYTASLGRYQNAKVILYFLSGCVLLLLGEWAVIALFHFQIYDFFWLTINGMSVVLGTLIWTVASEVCDARQAKRLFPLFTSVGILGTVMGYSLAGAFTGVIGSTNLILLYVIFLGIAVCLARLIARSFIKPEIERLTDFSILNDLRGGYDFVRTSGLFRLVAITSILYSILFFSIEYPFSDFVSREFQQVESAVAGFKGLFASVATIITFFVSLIFANRLYVRFGIINSILFLPIVYLVGFVSVYFFFGFHNMVIFRLVQQVMLGGIASAAWSSLFNVVPAEWRGQVLAFISGVPSQIGAIISGFLLIAGSRIFPSTQEILLLGAIAATICFYFTWKMRAQYGDALVAALRAGRTEVFSNDEDAFVGFKDDPAANDVLLKALEDPKPTTRRLAAEMLSKTGSLLVVSDLIKRLSDTDASVRAAVINAIASLGARLALSEVIDGLDDPDDSVREQALASLPKLRAGSTPKLIQTLERMLKDPNYSIRAHAAVVLTYLGEHKPARALIVRMLKHDDTAKRRIALDAFHHIAEGAFGKSSLQFDMIGDALNDSSPSIRREAIEIAFILRGNINYQLIIKRLSDVDFLVRWQASNILKQIWPQPKNEIVNILREMNEASLDAALDSIPPGDPEIQDDLRRYIQSEVSSIGYLRTVIASLPQSGKIVSLIIETLLHRVSLSEERLIKAVGLFGNPQALSLVRKSLNAGDAGTRAAALEAFETLGDRMITQQVLPILDQGGVFHVDENQKLEVSEAIGGLLISNDYWLRTISARAVAELDLKEHTSLLRSMKSDPVLLVSQVATDALAKMKGGTKMKTLKTLSTLDRLLLLREIPMFSRLSPEDLENIAEVAQEQLFAKNSVICREGEPGNSLFIIVHGMVNVIKGSGKQETILAVREEGQFVGEMAILESSMRSATLRSATDVRVLVLDGDSFTAILRDRPEVAISVLQHMSQRVRELNERVGVPA